MSCIFSQGELPTCLPIFLDRLRNEITRLTTVKALTKVAGSPLRIDLRPILVRYATTVLAYIKEYIMLKNLSLKSFSLDLKL